MVQRRYWRTLGVAVAFLAHSAVAQPTSNQELGRTVAHELLQALPLQDVITTAIAKEGGLGGFEKVRPGWGPIFVRSFTDEFIADRPRIEQLIGRKLAAHFTAEELAAGVALLSDPAVQAQMYAAVRKERAPSTPPGPKAISVMASPPGKSFLGKLNNLDDVLGTDTTNEIVVIVVPGWLRRLADQIDAAERARGAGQ